MAVDTVSDQRAPSPSTRVNIEHRTSNAEHRMEARILTHFGVRFQSIEETTTRSTRLGFAGAIHAHFIKETIDLLPKLN